MRENLVKPNFDTYHILIHACGKAGYAYKAQKLLFEFISRGQNPTKYMYTDVFTACAKSPIEERKNSLNYARRLRNKLNQKYLAIQQPVNKPLYNSMIAAFGRCGDLDTAFEIGMQRYAFIKYAHLTKKILTYINVTLQEKNVYAQLFDLEKHFKISYV